jgi:hypothetical protein
MNKESKTILENEVIDDWDKPMVCPIDPTLLAECEACQ